MKTKNKHKTFSQRARDIIKSFPRAKYDSIEKAALDQAMEKLMMEQEAVREAYGMNQEQQRQLGGFESIASSVAGGMPQMTQLAGPSATLANRMSPPGGTGNGLTGEIKSGIGSMIGTLGNAIQSLTYKPPQKQILPVYQEQNGPKVMQYAGSVEEELPRWMQRRDKKFNPWSEDLNNVSPREQELFNYVNELNPFWQNAYNTDRRIGTSRNVNQLERRLERSNRGIDGSIDDIGKKRQRELDRQTYGTGLKGRFNQGLYNVGIKDNIPNMLTLPSVDLQPTPDLQPNLTMYDNSGVPINNNSLTNSYQNGLINFDIPDVLKPFMNNNSNVVPYKSGYNNIPSVQGQLIDYPKPYTPDNIPDFQIPQYGSSSDSEDQPISSTTSNYIKPEEYKTSNFPALMSGLSTVAGNLGQWLFMNKGKNVTLPTYSPEKINLYNQRLGLRRDADLANRSALTQGRNLGLNAMQTMNAFNAGNSDIMRNLGRGLTESELAEQQFNAQSQNEANAFNANIKGRENMFNTQLDLDRDERSREYLAGIMSAAPGYVNDVYRNKYQDDFLNRQSISDANRLNVMQNSAYNYGLLANSPDTSNTGSVVKNVSYNSNKGMIQDNPSSSTINTSTNLSSSSGTPESIGSTGSQIYNLATGPALNSKSSQVLFNLVSNDPNATKNVIEKMKKEGKDTSSLERMLVKLEKPKRPITNLGEFRKKTPEERENIKKYKEELDLWRANWRQARKNENK